MMNFLCCGSTKYQNTNKASLSSVDHKKNFSNENAMSIALIKYFQDHSAILKKGSQPSGWPKDMKYMNESIAPNRIQEFKDNTEKLLNRLQSSQNEEILNFWLKDENKKFIIGFCNGILEQSNGTGTIADGVAALNKMIEESDLAPGQKKEIHANIHLCINDLIISGYTESVQKRDDKILLLRSFIEAKGNVEKSSHSNGGGFSSSENENRSRNDWMARQRSFEEMQRGQFWKEPLDINFHHNSYDSVKNEGGRLSNLKKSAISGAPLLFRLYETPQIAKLMPEKSTLGRRYPASTLEVPNRPYKLDEKTKSVLKEIYTKAGYSKEVVDQCDTFEKYMELLNIACLKDYNPNKKGEYAQSYSDDQIIDVRKRESKFPEESSPLVLQQNLAKDSNAKTCVQMLAEGKMTKDYISNITAFNMDAGKISTSNPDFMVGKMPGSMEELSSLIRKNGSAIVSVNSSKNSRQFVVVDEIDLKKEHAVIRDPWHGWQIGVRLAAFEKSVNQDSHVIQMNE